MSNPYYNATGNPPAQTRGSSNNMRSEFSAIAGGFDNFYNAMVSALSGKGAVGGQTWTGTHNFPATTYGVTASLGSSGNAFATLDFVNAVAFGSTLPAQTGNADKILTTNGSLASFSSTLKASVIRFADATDSTKQLAFSLSSLTTATTRTVTIPDKNGTLAMTSDTALILLATLTPTASANVDALSVFNSSYDNYVIVGNGIIPSVGDTLSFRFAVAGAVDSSSSYYTMLAGANTSTSATSGYVRSSSVHTAGGGGFVAHVVNANGTSGKQLLSNSLAQSNATFRSSSVDVTDFSVASAITGIRFFWSGGANFTASGKIRIYGYQNS